MLTKLEGFLRGQISKAGAKDAVEIVMLQDQGETVVGIKRNVLLDKAQGKFCAFVDDDDWVSDTYVPDILSAIRTYDDLDCVGFFGDVLFQGKHAGIMIHSTLCPCWTEKAGMYYRPPNHLNPIRADIARSV
ncbi:unnamed protein product, partial [marine sediment metagenome]